MIIHLKIVLILILLVYISQSKTNRAKHLLSTRMLNNYQTLDIKHYFLYQDDIKSDRNIQRIPINSTEIFELTTLNVINYNSKISKKSVSKIWEILNFVENKYINSYNDEKNIIYKKLFNSMEYFRRSFYNISYTGEPIMNLSLAIEILLSDNYEKNHYNHIKNRTEFLLDKKSRLIVENFFKVRGAFIHQGALPSEKELQLMLINTSRVYKRLLFKVINIVYTKNPKGKRPISTTIGYPGKK